MFTGAKGFLNNRSASSNKRKSLRAFPVNMERNSFHSGKEARNFLKWIGYSSGGRPRRGVIFFMVFSLFYIICNTDPIPSRLCGLIFPIPPQSGFLHLPNSLHKSLLPKE
jgi:hypothetical protein